MNNKLAVIFPGVGYHTDKPLLYYSKKLAVDYGYEIIEVNYGGFGSGIKGNAEKMQQAFENALSQAEEILEGTDWNREDILFITKSVGTAVASVYAIKQGLHPRFIYFTPVEATFSVMQEPCIIFHGDEDPWLPHRIFLEKIKETDYEYHVVKDTNHSLEIVRRDMDHSLETVSGDRNNASESGHVDTDLSNLQEIMKYVDRFISAGGVRTKYRVKEEANRDETNREGSNEDVTNREALNREGRPTEDTIFMNMCMICDGDRVVALDKVSSNYHGTTFPGGHVEPGETFAEAVIREVYEETGLTIRNPVLRGIYHWYRDGAHQIGLMYRATEFKGELKCSEEGAVYWISRADYEKKELAVGMRKVLLMMDDDRITECFMDIHADGRITEHVF